MFSLDNLVFGHPESGWRQNVSLTVAAGEICVIRGPSGSGKSTLLHTIAGFHDPISGTARWAGEDLFTNPPWARPVTMLFQSGNLFEHLTLAENVALGVRSSGQLSLEERDKMGAILADLGLDSLSNRYPHQLSGGQQQRAALARALLRHKPVLLLDEPFTGLDDARREAAITLISDISKTQNLAVLLVSHDERDAKRLAAQEYQLSA